MNGVFSHLLSPLLSIFEPDEQVLSVIHESILHEKNLSQKLENVGHPKIILVSNNITF